ncbi:IS30 family transposase [Candidatus Spongiihabitans sp.]|uniref:IS30 family transposase n=1 Tax=Candidatus Spongiihabitans sp. TaxID=3101308 RepID=UPI003C7D81BA
MKAYRRLCLVEREAIGVLCHCGAGIRAIAGPLYRSPSTISREINRNKRGFYYLAVTADNKARRRCYRRLGKLVQDPGLRRLVINGLRKQWSPAQISAKLKIDYPGDERMRVCAETLYTYLYVLPRGSLRQSLLRCLRQHRPARRPRSRGNDRRGRIPEMISIEERPAQVAERAVPGHWEGDLILGARHQSALGALGERATRTVLLVRLKRPDAETARKAFARKSRTTPKQMKPTLTHDQGKEMPAHRLFTKETRMPVCFAPPRSPWERGANENANGLIRRRFPKGADFNQVSAYQARKAQDRLNGRPRNVLNWKAPFEAFNELLQ